MASTCIEISSISSDIFLQCFRNGELHGFSRAIFEETFTRRSVSPRLPLENVTFLDGGRIEIYGGEEDPITDLMFSRYGGEDFFAALFELARITGSIIYWPDVRPALVVADAKVISHIPPDCLGTIGPAYVAADHRALMNYISRPITEDS